MENTLKWSTKARGDPDWPDQDDELKVLLTDTPVPLGLLLNLLVFSTM